MLRRQKAKKIIQWEHMYVYSSWLFILQMMSETIVLDFKIVIYIPTYTLTEKHILVVQVSFTRTIYTKKSQRSS